MRQRLVGMTSITTSRCRPVELLTPLPHAGVMSPKRKGVTLRTLSGTKIVAGNTCHHDEQKIKEKGTPERWGGG